MTFVRAWRTAMALACAMAGASCEQPAAPKRYRLTFEVYSDLNPLPNVQILLRNRPAGFTDVSGTARFELPGRDGLVVPVGIQCPEGTRSPTGTIDITLRTLDGLDRAAAARGIVQRVNCPPVDRTIALLVRTDGRAGLPVMWQGRMVSRTDEAGVAAMTFRVQPQTAVQLTLDTSGDPTLRPQNPVRQVVAGDTDDAFVWSQTFEQEVVRRPRRHVSHGPRIIRPVRIESHTRW